MAPHDTNTPKEARRHLVPLVGIAIAVAVAIIGFVWWIGYATSGDETSEPGAPVEQTAPATSP
jgi:hypothetical protein